MTEATNTSSATTTENKFSLAQIEENCPVMLQDLGKPIAIHSEKAKKCENNAGQHYTTIAQLLVMARGACDEGGFTAFQKMFFPDLGKSRVYELFAIGTNKKSVEEIRADTRSRVAKHRTNKTAASISVTVTDKSKPEPCMRGAPNEGGEIEAPGIAPEQVPEPSKPCTARATEVGLHHFAGHTLELHKGAQKRPPEYFSKTTVPVEILENLGHLFTKLTNMKKSEAVKAARTAGSGASSLELPAENACVDTNCPAAEVSR